MATKNMMFQRPTKTQYQVMLNEYNQIQLSIYDVNLKIATTLVKLFNSFSEYAQFVQSKHINADQIVEGK